jgi:hypothetical protein
METEMSATIFNDRTLRGAEHHAAPDSQLRVFVLYTGVRRTLAALRGAARLAAGLNARIEVIFPQVVPYPLPIEEPAASPGFAASRLARIAEEAEIETSMHVYLCRDRREAVASALPPGAMVVIGYRRRWWPTSAYRFGRWLRGNGHRVIFVDARSQVLEV